MKKIMMALAVVGLAFGAQAATYVWKSSAAAYGVDASAVVDNGSYTAGTTVMRGKGTWNVVLALFDASTGALVGETSATGIKFSTTGNKFNTSGLTIDAAAQGATYNYVLTITGTQNDLNARGEDGEFDYSAAQLTTTIEGTIETAAMGNTTLTSAVPSNWTVSGITAVPEPTSGLLMLVGLAGLALRRRRA